MCYLKIIIVLIIFISILSADDIENDNPVEIISKANNDFSFKLFKMLSNRSNPNENHIISSLSILSAFSILMNGANGETLTDFKSFLEYEDQDEGLINLGFQEITRIYQDAIKKKSIAPSERQNLALFKHKLNMANKLVHSRKIKLMRKFKSDIIKHFRADVKSADFENNSDVETKRVNQWVRNKTNQKIQKIFDNIAKDTSLLIINILYFSGQWDEIFKLTKKLDFYNNGVTAVNTDIMTQTNVFSYFDSEELDSQVLQMDYIGNKISFVIVLPKERNGLKALKEEINAENFDNALKSMRKRNIEIFIPKFKVEKSYGLMTEIQPKPIALTSDADFSRMTAENVIVCRIKHKLFIDVNEKGTEAAAVTAVKLTPKNSVPKEKFNFRADHPFLYFIRDKSNGIILFSGQLNKL